MSVPAGEHLYYAHRTMGNDVRVAVIVTRDQRLRPFLHLQVPGASLSGFLTLGEARWFAERLTESVDAIERAELERSTRSSC